MTYSLAGLHGKNVVVYDLEIKKPIEECSKGWNSHDEMGISVGCAFDYQTMKYGVYMDDNIALLLLRLNQPGTLVVAFNHISFDNRLLRATGLPLKPDEELRNFDMMVVSKRGASSSAGPTVHKGFRLDDHLAARKLPMKTANGATAPLMWQNKEIGSLVDYCLNDVQVERALFEDMWVNGVTACAAYPVPYQIERPEVFS
jgi:hypothetical protein